MGAPLHGAPQKTAPKSGHVTPHETNRGGCKRNSCDDFDPRAMARASSAQVLDGACIEPSTKPSRSIPTPPMAITQKLEPSYLYNPCSTLTHSLPDGTQDPCGYRRNAYPRIICLSPGHAATHIMPNTLASVSVSTESVTVLALRTMVHSGLVAPLGHKAPAHACRRVPMHPVDPPNAWRGDPMRLLALISHCGSRHIHRAAR